MYTLPEPRNHRGMYDCRGHMVSEKSFSDLIVRKLCYLESAYQLMSNKRCLEIWNNYYYGGSLFEDGLC